jgi:hypothetical protein
MEGPTLPSLRLLRTASLATLACLPKLVMSSVEGAVHFTVSAHAPTVVPFHKPSP